MDEELTVMPHLILAIVATVAIKHWWQRAKAEYAHTRDRAEREFRGAHPDWSDRKVRRRARHRARGYWWDQIIHGLPDLKRAHKEAKDLAEAERHEAEVGSERYRAELRRRIDEAMREKEQLRREEMERNRARADEVRRSAPCPYCRAAAGEECRPTCPDRAAREMNRARDAQEATVPPRPSTDGTEPPTPTEPHRTVPPPGRTTEPAPNHTVPPDYTVPPAPAEPHDESPVLNEPEKPAISVDEQSAPAIPPEVPPTGNPRPTPAESDRTVTPITKNQSRSATGTNGEQMSVPATTNGSAAVPTGDFAGYEATTAGWDQITQLSAQLDHAYEQQMAALRHHKADDQTVGMTARARETNEAHMLAARAAREDWISRQGAVKETKDATGARGDQALHD